MHKRVHQYKSNKCTSHMNIADTGTDPQSSGGRTHHSRATTTHNTTHRITSETSYNRTSSDSRASWNIPMMNPFMGNCAVTCANRADIALPDADLFAYRRKRLLRWIFNAMIDCEGTTQGREVPIYVREYVRFIWRVFASCSLRELLVLSRSTTCLRWIDFVNTKGWNDV